MKEKTKDTLSIVNLIYLFIVLVWIPVQMLFLGMDGKGRIIFALTLLVFIINLFNRSVRKLMFGKPFVFWLIWVFYAFINMMNKGFNVEVITPGFYLVNYLLLPYVAMVLTCFEGMKNRKRLLKTLLSALAIYIFCGVTMTQWMKSSTDIENVLSMGNLLPITISFTIYMLCLYKIDNNISNSFFIAALGVLFLIIIAAAVRKSFGVSVILLVFYFFTRIVANWRNIIVIVVIAGISYWGLGQIMSNTLLGERIGMTREQASETNNYSSDNAFLLAMGDRATHYVLGWELFLQHPTTGIGLENFTKVSGYPMRLHSEYMVQFAENGIIGILLYFIFISWFFKCLIKSRKMEKWREYAVMGLGWMTALLFINFSTWTYDMTAAFVCTGLTASMIFGDYKKAS